MLSRQKLVVMNKFPSRLNFCLGLYRLLSSMFLHLRLPWPQVIKHLLLLDVLTQPNALLSSQKQMLWSTSQEKT